MLIITIKSRYFFTLILLISIIAGCTKKTPALPLLSNDSVVLAFGDSLTYGYNVTKNKSYPALLQKLTGLKVINAGISGEVSEEVLARFPKVLNDYNPKLVILCHGGNDLLRKMDIEEMESNIRAMIQLSLDRKIPLILLGVPKPGIFLSSADVYKEIASSMNTIFMEDLVSNVLSDKLLKSDSIHPNENGYNVMAEEIYSLLLDSGAIK